MVSDKSWNWPVMAPRHMVFRQHVRTGAWHLFTRTAHWSGCGKAHLSDTDKVAERKLYVEVCHSCI